MNTYLKQIAAFSFFTLITHFSFSQEVSLQRKVEDIIQSKRTTVGIAIIGNEGKDIVVTNSDYHFPMQSTYKFHLTLMILHLVDQGSLSLDQTIHVTKNDLLPNTHSPLREKYPEGNIDIPLREIIEYTVSQSDNNGCDILFRLAGGTEKVNQYIKGLGVTNINIAATEEEMHKDWDVQHRNWTTPLASAKLLELFYKGKVLSQDSYSFLWKTMTGTVTGPNKIKGLLPENTIVAHKTGSGPKKDGVISACNDIGIVMLPDGKYFVVAAFIANSKENDETNDRIIAEVTKAAWDYFNKKDSSR